jgi:hypothetical protein
VTPIQIAVPESLTAQKAELEIALAGIATEEQKLATQRKDIQTALATLASGIAILSGKALPASKVATPTGRKPMSPEARLRIGEGLRKYREARALAKAAQVAASASQASAPEPADAQMVAVSETLGKVPADAPELAPAHQEPAEAPAEAPVPDSPRGSRATRKAARR